MTSFSLNFPDIFIAFERYRASHYFLPYALTKRCSLQWRCYAPRSRAGRTFYENSWLRKHFWRISHGSLIRRGMCPILKRIRMDGQSRLHLWMQPRPENLSNGNSSCGRGGYCSPETMAIEKQFLQVFHRARERRG